MRGTGAAILVVPRVLLFAIGFRGWGLVLAVLVGWLPLGVAAMAILNRLFPPLLATSYSHRRGCPRTSLTATVWTDVA